MTDLPTRDRLATWQALLEPAASELLAKAKEIEDLVRPGPKDLAMLRVLAGPQLVAAGLELTQARRKGEAKYQRSHEMLMDLAGLEQATADDVALWKARRFADKSGPIWDLCAGIGGDAMALQAMV